MPRISSPVLLTILFAPFALACVFAYFQTNVDSRLNKEYVQPGIASYKRHDYTDAERDFRAYLRHGSDVGVHYNLGMCLLNEGKKEEALQEFLRDTYVSSVGHSEYTRIRERSRLMIDQITGNSSF